VTAVTERTVCVRFDERPYEWRTVTDSRGWADLIDQVLTPPPVDSPWWVHGHRILSVGDPHDPTEGLTLFFVAVGAGGGAAYYRDMPNGVARGWVTHNPDPAPNAPALAFSAQGGTSFTPDAVVDLDDLRRVIDEFLESGRRPECVAWQEAEWIQ
jgi:hypothetical protein